MIIRKDSQSPNFGMAVKIKPAALKSATSDAAKTVERLTEELADTKFTNLEIKDDLTPRIVAGTGNSFVPPFKFEKPNGKYLIYSAVSDGCTSCEKGEIITSCINTGSKEAALKAYEKLSAAGDDLEKAGELTKLMDKDFENSGLGVKKKTNTKSKMNIIDSIESFFNVLDWM